MSRLRNVPLMTLLIGVVALSMFVPALYALGLNEHAVGRAFLYSGALFSVLALILGIATMRPAPQLRQNDPFMALLVAFAVLPVVMAFPVVEAVEGIRFFDAWFEMLSCFTTTGATIFDVPRDVPSPVHLWRAIVGWGGGFFILISAVALLAPRNLGGFELLSGRNVQRARELDPSIHSMAHAGSTLADPMSQLWFQVRVVGPVYVGATLLLWIGLALAGNPSLLALMQAMSTMATSGISSSLTTGAAGGWGEGLMFIFMAFALTRRSLPGAGARIDPPPLRADPELRLAGAIVLIVTTLLVLRHWNGARDVAEAENLVAAARAIWGAAFTSLSFLSTNGFVSQDWITARAWSGLTSPGLILLGVALLGGGVATTAGGLKLMRVFALMKQGRREIERLVNPSSVGGDGPRLRHLRKQGAFSAWLFLMVFVLTLCVIMALLTASGMGFETGLVFSIAALTTTGPLVQVATEIPLSWALLSDPAKAILAVAMVLGRLELLALLTLLMPRLYQD
jgi:trk system potassium uptake protein TrkH